MEHTVQGNLKDKGMDTSPEGQGCGHSHTWERQTVRERSRDQKAGTARIQGNWIFPCVPKLKVRGL